MPGRGLDRVDLHVDDAEAVNLVLDAAQRAGERGVHLCFGNYGGQSIQTGHWERLLGYINLLRCDHVILEFAHRGYECLSISSGSLGKATIAVHSADDKAELLDLGTLAQGLELAVAAAERAAQALPEEI